MIVKWQRTLAVLQHWLIPMNPGKTLSSVILWQPVIFFDLVLPPSRPDKQILYVPITWLLSLGVIFSWNHEYGFALNNVVTVDFSERLHATRTGSQQFFFFFLYVSALWTQKAEVMGSWKKKRGQQRPYTWTTLCTSQFLIKLHRTWHAETAYPHCSLGKCQLVLRTSKQSFLPLLYSPRAPTVL